ncbi:MAG: hypothetical protein GY747_02015 [Planctomycetes bacterium]|nr:hypothetical protein [Planctomycetota bacterium]MCP4770004.1 hypothetical protein [Planctomycetota bacterium]MCP4859844.1 hypothetical protein [Planctomycetota bacterium]
MNARTINIVWLLLVALTTGSWLLADGGHVAWLIGLAAIKLVMVQAWFMELLHCRPLFIRIAVAADALILGLVLIALV